MNLRPDRERTATGYVWLDKITAPYWAITMHLHHRRFWKLLTPAGTNWRQARTTFQAWFRRTHCTTCFEPNAKHINIYDVDDTTDAGPTQTICPRDLADSHT